MKKAGLLGIFIILCITSFLPNKLVAERNEMLFHTIASVTDHTENHCFDTANHDWMDLACGAPIIHYAPVKKLSQEVSKITHELFRHKSSETKHFISGQLISGHILRTDPIPHLHTLSELRRLNI